MTTHAKHAAPKKQSHTTQAFARYVDKGDTFAANFNPRTMTIRRLVYIVLGAPAFFPLVCVYPDIIVRNFADLNVGADDVLGAGAEICFLIAMLVSPLVLITGKRWLMPLRKWYGIMAGIIALVAGILSPILSLRFGPAYMVMGNLALASGYLLVVLFMPLLFTSNKYSLKHLGKYWRTVHKTVYVIWALLAFHLFVIFGLTGQPFYWFVLCSLPLVVYRIPIMKKAIPRFRKLGFNTAIYIMSIPWVAMFVVPFVMIIHTEAFKGVATISGHSIAN